MTTTESPPPASAGRSGSAPPPGGEPSSYLFELIDRPEPLASRDALVLVDETLSYAELARRSTEMARRLAGLGVRAGDAVGVLLPGGSDYFALLLGVSRLGALTVPVNARFKASEIARLVTHAGLRVICTTSEGMPAVDYPALFAEALPGLSGGDPAGLALGSAPSLRQVVLLDGAERPGLLTAEAFAQAGEAVTDEQLEGWQAAIDPADPALVLYTSGTTASPKGCVLTHRGLVAQARALGTSPLRLGTADRVWCPLPTFHISANAAAVATWYAGAAFCHPGQFEAGAALAQLAGERCTVALPGFETVWLEVLNLPELAGSDLSALRLVFSVGVRERLRLMQTMLPHAPMVSAFGGTESGGWLSIGDPDDDEDVRVGTGGRPLPGMEIRIVDIETGEPCPPGTPGEIWFRGPQRFVGYYHDEAYTKSVIDEDDWFHSGDVCVLDEGGRLSYVSRLKDMMKVGGENVAAAEVEDYLARHPAVRIVQVVAAPDARYVEVPAAFVQLVPGRAVSERELIESCVGRIASYKIPRYVRFVEDWPMSGTKIQKYKLREAIAADLAAKGISEGPRITSRGVEWPGEAPGTPLDR